MWRWLLDLFFARRPAPVVPPPTPIDAVDGFTPESLPEVNRIRSSSGRGPLLWDDRLALCSLWHSQEQARRDQMGHSWSGYPDLPTRARAAGYLGPVWHDDECVGWNYPDGVSVVRGWAASPGHRRVLIDPSARRVGVAFALGPSGPYWTLVTGA